MKKQSTNQVGPGTERAGSPDVRDLIERTRVARGLTSRVTDPLLLARLAALYRRRAAPASKAS
jgi:hypothetical protein